jgi:uncharacterized protein (DUF58 family)
MTFRPTRLAALFLVAASVTTVIAALTDGALAYALSAIGLVLVVALGTPFVLILPRRRDEKSLSKGHERLLRGARLS